MEHGLADLKLLRPTISLLALALLLCWETARPFFPFYAGAMRRRAAHLGRNLLMGLANISIGATFLMTLWSVSADWSLSGRFGLLHRLPLAPWLHALLAVVLLDIWTYWWHRANHRLPVLWRFHRMHHSDPSMDVSSARRFHPVEILLSSALRIPLIALLGIHIWELVLYEMTMSLIVDFHHANVGLPRLLDRALRAIIVTPDMHKIHHSRLQPETDSNYTSMLSLWDRLFGSFRMRPDPAAISIGLDRWDAPPHQTLSGMLGTPFTRP